MSDQTQQTNQTQQSQPWWQSAINAATGVIQTGYNIFTGERARQDQLDQAKIMRDREDTAVTRRVQDMVNAGLHPTLAAGNPAQAQNANIQQPQKISGLPESVMAAAMFNAQVQNVKAQTDLTRAEAQRVRTYLEGSDPDYMLRSDMNEDLRSKIKMETQSIILDNIGRGAPGYWIDNYDNKHFINADTDRMLVEREKGKLQNEIARIIRDQSQVNYDVDKEFLRTEVEMELKLLAKELKYYDAKAIIGMGSDVVGSILGIRNMFRGRNVHNHMTNVNIPFDK